MTKQSKISQIPQLRTRLKHLADMREQGEQTLAKTQDRLASLLAEAGLTAFSPREECERIPGLCDYQELVGKCESHLEGVDSAIGKVKQALAHAQAAAFVSLILRPMEEFAGDFPPSQETKTVIH
ncbi:hypothetical protein [Imhoffiella purpurea]|uniref:Uncharacterized protein n=1 Tax=Imhoffiella purpurea TaxID=1249627 RepID=W9V186_9GAMM|nr:hypothetical protein [Imhoffiella purpurea]EXJ13243.1 hypothetical protein D779_3921 [Imhoffiella purpurea]